MILFIFEYLCRVSYVVHAIKGFGEWGIECLGFHWFPEGQTNSWAQLDRRVKIHENIQSIKIWHRETWMLHHRLDAGTLCPGQKTNKQCTNKHTF